MRLSRSTASATGTITGDDTRPTIGIGNAAVLEGNAGTATLTFTVTRTGDAEADQTFNYTFTDGSTEAGDFDHTGGALVFVKNLFVCDGASFVTNPDKNPTLTISALSWRAADYMAEEMRKGNV